MIDIIDYPTTDADHYLELLPPETAAELTAVADRFRDSKVIHINSAAYGGGVAEILHSLVPPSNALGIPTQRAVISPKDPRFFDVTKLIHSMRDRVRRRFLIPWLLNDYLRAAQQARSDTPQPVC